MSGFWNPRGKTSGYIYGRDKSGGAVVYVKATNERGLVKQTELENSIHSGAPIEVTGVLRLYEPVGLPTSESQFVQVEPAHFYFDVADISIRVVAR